ncbi:dehydrogenase [Kitasatospora griseola]|uniref:Dehydrogenase n=1 Tax=Kitasatospora griseola TaxID=2064 RepID=A0A0D0PIH5_KITGR|nr:FAD binding domain-containing protein [Kitasatospora griseola]KIQ62269.1 dehydrogenase [Kitasatospora griseola]
MEHGGNLVNRTIMMPASVDEAVEALAATPGAVPVAGATDLMEAVNGGRLRPAALIGLGRITELRGWRYEDGGTAVLGAGLTHARMDRPDFAALIPALADAARTAGPPQVRNVGTLGGNIATGAPAGDTLPVLAALEATATLARPGTVREVPISHLLTGLDPLRPGELLTWVRVPLLHAPQVFLKSTGRSGPSRAAASVALVLDPARRGVRCAVGAVAPVPLRPLEAESWVAGCIDWDARGQDGAVLIDPAALAAFGEYAAAACVPEGAAGGEGAGPAGARLRRTVAVLARRALGRALK